MRVYVSVMVLVGLRVTVSVRVRVPEPLNTSLVAWMLSLARVWVSGILVALCAMCRAVAVAR